MLLLLLFLLLSAGGSGGVLMDFRSPATLCASAKICSALAETARSNRFSSFSFDEVRRRSKGGL